MAWKRGGMTDLDGEDMVEEEEGWMVDLGGEEW